MRAERLLTVSESPHVQANLPGIVLKDTKKWLLQLKFSQSAISQAIDFNQVPADQ